MNFTILNICAIIIATGTVFSILLVSGRIVFLLFENFFSKRNELSELESRIQDLEFEVRFPEEKKAIVTPLPNSKETHL